MNQKHYLKDRHCQNEFMKTKKKERLNLCHIPETHIQQKNKERLK